VSVRRDLVLACLLQGAAALAIASVVGWSWAYAAAAAAALAVAAWFVARAFAAASGSALAADFGAANRITLLRLALGMLLAAAVWQPIGAPPAVAWAFIVVATVAALLDAVDGPLARRAGRASAFGARFDMETDAWFTLVLSALVWQLDRAGVWVLASGAMRYAFVAATWAWPWLGGPLAPPRRRQTVCVVQIVLLIVALAPIWPPALAAAFCATGLALLVASFGADIRMLWRRRRGDGSSAPPPSGVAGTGAGTSSEAQDTGIGASGMGTGSGTGRSDDAATPAMPANSANPAMRPGAWIVRFAAAAFVLNTLFTFESRLDGIGVHWSPRLSFELVVGLLLLLAWFAWRRRLGAAVQPGARGTWGLAGLATLLVLGRYVDVTVPAFFGRPVNLYWDAPHAGQLVALAWASWPAWQVLGAVCALLLALTCIASLARWAIGTLADTLQVRAAWPWLTASGALLCTSFVVYPWAGADTRWFFALPITPTFARQAAFVATALSKPRTEALLTPSPGFAAAHVDALHGADVLLLFAESYGMTTFAQPAQAQALAMPRERFMHALQLSGRQVVSARVRSPTFGGGSWLAHGALLAGVDTQDPDDYNLLLTTRRPTLATHFAQHGYRTVGWMPGMQRPWPEGRFFGFERLADARSIGYAGPVFGYWGIPDQASMALLHAQELAEKPTQERAQGHVQEHAQERVREHVQEQVAPAARRPRFVFFPTLDTHAPFHPLAPYQPHWERLLTADAWAPAQVAEANAAAAQLDWVAGYVRAMALTYDWLGDYLRDRASPALVTIVIGDHQPLAAVAGAGASWDVPVHVITRSAVLAERLKALGFVSGLDPGTRTLGAMHELTGLLVRAFDAPRVDVPGTGPGLAR
jgi:phosphatidylglycerophosphate synthase